jgi:heterodisulfide reductase subunit C2
LSKETATKEITNVVPDFSFLREVEKASEEPVSACYRCLKCSSGCPVSFAMDYLPHAILQMVQLGMKKEVLTSDTIWVCASCQTCNTRCPNDIGIAHIMDTLRQLSQREGIPASKKDVPIFHSAFLSSIRRFSKIHEGSMAAEFTLRSAGLKGLIQQAGLGLTMFKKGKLNIFPAKLFGNRQVKSFFKQAKRKR